MESQQQKKNSSNDESKYERVVVDWLEASSNFYMYYRQVVTCIHEKVIDPNMITDEVPYIGQCPIGELVTLAMTMQGELEKLIQDIDQFAVLMQPTTQKHFKTLIRHTLLLKRLNHQAQTRLHLVSLTTS